MSVQVGCETARESFGVLVLGALDPVERDAVERHIFECPTCPAVLAEVSSLPGLLKRLDEEHPASGEPPEHVLDSVLARVRAEDRARRTRTVRRVTAGVLAVAAAGALVLAIGVIGRGGTAGEVAGPATSTPSASASAPASATASSTTATDHGTGVTATVALRPDAIGTQLDVTVNGVSPGEHCEIVVVGLDGQREVAASWVAGYVGQAEVRGTTGITADRIARVEIATPGGRHLVTVPVASAPGSA